MRQLLKKIKYLLAAEAARHSGLERPSPHTIDLRKRFIEEIAQSVYESQRLQRGLPRIH